MVLLCRPKRLGRLEFRRNRPTVLALFLLHVGLAHLFLFRRMKVHTRPVLRTTVTSLSVDSRGVNESKEFLQQCLVLANLGVVVDHDALGMARSSTAYLSVRGVLFRSLRVTNGGVLDSRYAIKQQLGAPETASWESDKLGWGEGCGENGYK